jgi:hypothetical protein
MSEQYCNKEATLEEKNALFEIPIAWDGKPKNNPNLMGTHYLVNERSNKEAMYQVWNVIRQRAIKMASPQFVSILFHTHAMKKSHFHIQCENILDYMQNNGGIPVTASKAKIIYDNTVQLTNNKGNNRCC